MTVACRVESSRRVRPGTARALARLKDVLIVLNDAPSAGLADLRTRYLTAQLEGDRRSALEIVLSALRSGEHVLAIQRHVIQAAQREVGRLWQEDLISVAEEHMATAISQLALAHLYDHAERAADNGKVVWVACVEGELHDLPARLVADTLELAGFQVKYLGANVPTASLLEMLERGRPDLLALSVTTSFNLPTLYGAATQVRARHADLAIAIGGGACQLAAGAIESLSADICVRDGAELVAAASDRLGVAAAR